MLSGTEAGTIVALSSARPLDHASIGVKAIANATTSASSLAVLNYLAVVGNIHPFFRGCRIK